MRQPTMIVHLRPMMSATSPAMIGAKESTSGENRGDEGQVRTGEGVVSRGNICRARALDELDEPLRASDTVDVPGVITEEDTTEGGEGAHHVGLPGDRSLDALDIVSRAQRADCVSRHDGVGVSNG